MQEIIKTSTIDINLINFQNEHSTIDLIDKCESSYINQIDDLISDILSLPKIKILLLTGPSSSGKTTTANLIASKLIRCNIPSTVISMDDFFINRENTPILEDGTYDFENVNTIDIPLFKSFLNEIFISNKTKMPRFDFVEGKRTGFENIEIEKNGIIIIEGIHALNPIFISKNNSEIYRVYVCPNTNFTLNNKIILKPNELRKIRRLIRDYFHRGMTINQTLSLWNNVCLGEEKYIKPFKHTANFWIDSTHNYEPLLYKKYLPPILNNSLTCNAIKNSLQHFSEIDIEYLPNNSLLMEFLSGIKNSKK